MEHLCIKHCGLCLVWRERGCGSEMSRPSESYTLRTIEPHTKRKHVCLSVSFTKLSPQVGKTRSDWYRILGRETSPHHGPTWCHEKDGPVVVVVWD